MFQSQLSAALICLAVAMPVWASTEGSMPVTCANKQEMSDMLEAHGERAMMTMISLREINGEIVEIPTVLFANPATLSWTLVARPRPEVYCAVIMGNKIRPY